jgi:hypothetical protein
MSCRTRPICAATRTSGPRAERRGPRALVAAALLGLTLFAAVGCRSEADEEKLSIHKVESKHFYDFGDYALAEDQCRRGLKIEPGDAQLTQMLAYCLLMQAAPKQLDEASKLFDSQIGWFGTSDWRLDFGAGMTDQERARLLSTSKLEADQAEMKRLRAKARAHLEKAYAATHKANNEPPELLYHLALLDLDEGKLDLFRDHAEAGVKLMLVADKVSATQIRQTADDKARARTEKERSINAERARRLLHELARLAWNQTPPDATTAAAHMSTIEKFGALSRSDFFNRGRIREATGDLEGAVSDYEKFLSMSADVADENVTKAVERLTKLRSHLAEKRTGGAASGQ